MDSLREDGAVAGYVIGERCAYGPREGEIRIDWCADVYEDRAEAEAELALANRPLDDDPTQTPSDHWKLYELREVI